MAKLAIIFGVLLIVIGVVGFAPHRAPTALIPAYVGAILVICGAIATNPAYRMHAMHVAVVVALLTFIMVGWRLIGALLGKTVPAPLALFSQIATAVVTALFVVLSVRSFAAARRAREGQ